jgi:hypothetical protein
MDRENVKWIVGCLGVLIAVVLVPLLLLVGPLNQPNNAADHLGAVLIFVGSLVTAAVSFISITVKRESDQRLTREHDDEEARLRLEAQRRQARSSRRIQGSSSLLRSLQVSSRSQAWIEQTLPWRYW